MTHVSRKKLEDKILREVLNFLLLSLTNIKSEKEMGVFLNAFLSSTEKVMLAKRLGIAYLLSEGVPEERVSEVLCIGRPTIDKMKLWMRVEGKGYELALGILRRNERFEEFKQIFSAILSKMAHPYKGLLSQPYYKD